MKKVLFIIAMLSIASSMISCANKQAPDYNVTVITKTDGLLSKIVAPSMTEVAVINESGDTLTALCEDSLITKHKLPFEARMAKTSTMRHGYVYAMTK